MQSQVIHGDLRKIQLPKVGFYLLIETSEDDGDYSKAERIFFKDLESVLKEYLLLEDLNALKENDPDKLIDYIGYTNCGILRDLDSFEIVEVLMHEDSLFERNIKIENH